VTVSKIFRVNEEMAHEFVLFEKSDDAVARVELRYDLIELCGANQFGLTA